MRNKGARDAPPIVYLHGAMSAGTIWLVLSRKLAEALPGRSGYLLDLPGHGGSPGDPLDSIGAAAAAVVGFLDEQSIPRATLVGHSLGGGVAQTVALDWPERVERLVLLSTGAVLGVNPQILEVLASDFDGALSLMQGFVFARGADERLLGPAVETMRSVGAEVALTDFRACQAFDSRARLPDLAAPAVVCCGSEDLMTSPKKNRLLAESLGCPYHEIPGAGHMLPIEGAEELVPILVPFLQTRRST
jgi:pimeloyl-ACP methyl ester carboxylesterase